MRSTTSDNTATLADLSFSQVNSDCLRKASAVGVRLSVHQLSGFLLSQYRKMLNKEIFYKLKLKRINFSWSSPVEGDGAS